MRNEKIQEMIDREIKSNAENRKLTNKSYQILVNKLKNTLIGIIGAVKKNSQNYLTFEELGRIFFQLNIFKVLQYDSENIRNLFYSKLIFF